MITTSKLNNSMVFSRGGRGSRNANTYLILKNSNSKNSNLTLYFAMSQNGQTHFKNLAAFAARFFKRISPFYDIVK